MAIMAKEKGGKDFPAPPTGVHPALCIDIIDLGEQETPFLDRGGNKKVQHQIQIVWQLHNKDEDDNPMVRTDGKPFRVSKYYTLSLNEMANLRKDLDSWRGKPFTDEELEDGFDVEKLLHVQSNLSLIEKKVKGKDKPKIVVDTVLRPSKRDPEIEADPEYTREKDRPGGRDMRSPPADDSNTPQPNDYDDTDDESDDLPF